MGTTSIERGMDERIQMTKTNIMNTNDESPEEPTT